MFKQAIPVANTQRHHLLDGESLLAADVGGTKTDMAIFEMRDGKLVLGREAVFASAQFNSFTDVVQRFKGDHPLPERLSIAFAGPIVGGKAVATNLGWSIDAAQLSRDLDIEQVFLLNDLEAEAYGLAALTRDDIETICPGKTPATGNVGIIAPGTGLGEAGMFWDGHKLHPFASEGGHADFAPRNEFDWGLLQYLQKQFGHVSWERVLSGSGIFQIYRFLRDVKKWEEPKWMEEQLETLDPAAAISLGAQQSIVICEETLQVFMRYLAMEASNMALKFNATGGIFLGGGILPKIWNPVLHEIFAEHFFQVGRLRPLLENVPVYLVLNHKTVLLGAAHYAR